MLAISTMFCYFFYMQEMIARFKALGDSNRFRIVMMLRMRPLCVCEILSVIPVSGGTMSGHLKILQHAGLISSRKDGKWIEYFIAEDADDFVKQIRSEVTDDSILREDEQKISCCDRVSCAQAR